MQEYALFGTLGVKYLKSLKRSTCDTALVAKRSTSPNIAEGSLVSIEADRWLKWGCTYGTSSHALQGPQRNSTLVKTIAKALHCRFWYITTLLTIKPRSHSTCLLNLNGKYTGREGIYKRCHKRERMKTNSAIAATLR